MDNWTPEDFEQIIARGVAKGVIWALLVLGIVGLAISAAVWIVERSADPTRTALIITGIAFIVLFVWGIARRFAPEPEPPHRRR